MAEPYATVCPAHTSHCDNCGRCIAFDRAVKKQLSTYTLPPHSHPVVVKARVQEWLKSGFTIPVRS